MKTALKQGKYYPKLVLTDADGGRAQCFTYEAYKADSKNRPQIKRQITALSKAGISPESVFRGPDVS